MDNQNANNGGFPQNPNPPQNNNQQPTPNQNANNLENVRTQSVIESAREVAEKELAAQQAYNLQVLKAQQAAARREEEKHIAVKVALAIFGVIIAIALIWLVIEVIKILNTGSRSDGCVNSDGTISKSCCDRAEYKDHASCQDVIDPLPTIEGYKCTQKDCKKMADIVKNERMIIRDKSYIIYDAKKNSTTTTTIDNSIDYTSMSVFEWGKGKYYAILKPSTEESGLYSISDNQQVIPNKITRFYHDINHKAYNGMKDVLGKYIIVRESSQYRLYDIITGKELANASDGIFTYGKYIMAYHEGGIRRVYNFDKRQIALVNPGEEVYMRSGYMVVSGKSFYVYDNLGNRQNASKNSVYQDILKQKASERANYLKKSKNYYHMPTSRDYSD